MATGRPTRCMWCERRPDEPRSCDVMRQQCDDAGAKVSEDLQHAICTLSDEQLIWERGRFEGRAEVVAKIVAGLGRMRAGLARDAAFWMDRAIASVRRLAADAASPAPTATREQGEPACPQCGEKLLPVRYPGDSTLNRHQWEAIRAGDWHCTTCPPNGRGETGMLCYWWDLEVSRSESAHVGALTIETARGRADRDGFARGLETGMRTGRSLERADAVAWAEARAVDAIDHDGDAGEEQRHYESQTWYEAAANYRAGEHEGASDEQALHSECSDHLVDH